MNAAFEIVDDLLGLFTELCLLAARAERNGHDMTERELLSLALLRDRGTLTVGEIHRRLGIAPAQMSRVLHRLESRTRPHVVRQFHPQDKRRVNIDLSPAGRKTLLECQARRAKALAPLLSGLSEEDCNHVKQAIDKLREVFRASPPPQSNGTTYSLNGKH